MPLTGAEQLEIDMAQETPNTNEAQARGCEASELSGLVMHPPHDIKKAVAYLQEYMNTYGDQIGYEDYSLCTFINDVLYGLGGAIDPVEHRYSDGFERFKSKLRIYLNA